MYLDVPFKEIKSNLDITALKEAVLKATEEEWYENIFRKEQGGIVGEQVETILFNLNGGGTPEGIAQNPSKTFFWENVWDKWKDLVEPVMEEAISGYDNHEKAFVNKCLIPRMRPGTTIPEHTDLSVVFNVSHRIHVPLVTNPDVYFMIDGERCVMEEGNAYEINNKVMHSVENRGSETRIHLLFDIYIPKEA
jgi:hypothetical protein